MDETQDKRRAERAEIYTHGVNAALLINGGGAIALLTFLQSVWGSNSATVGPIIDSLLFLALGVFTAALVNPCRYYTSLYCTSTTQRRYRSFWWCTAVSHFVSLASFAVAIVLLVVQLRAVPRND